MARSIWLSRSKTYKREVEFLNQAELVNEVELSRRMMMRLMRTEIQITKTSSPMR